MPAKMKPALKKPGPAAKKAAGLDFPALVDAIRQVHEQSAAAVSRTVNTSLTLRNWVIGWYIREYEQNGSDRAKYGEGLLDALAERMSGLNVSNCNRRQLYRYLRFFQLYPEIVGTLSPQLRLLPGLPGESPPRLPKGDPGKVGTVSPLLGAPAEHLINRLSYSHLELIVDLEDPLKRAFYEIECIRGSWSVRDLKRQIVTLYFERSGLSKDKEKLAAMVQQGIETAEPKLAIRDPYIFEFLGLRAKDAVAESELEAALVEHLREFLLKLGHGFCLEAQQKSIVIGKTRGFVDLVFYHRILKCHVLVELKVDEFRHEYIGQLTTYVTWYRKHMMSAGDNPPVGILLCTEKDHTLVEYATASMDNQLFVSKYAVELPSKAELVKFLEKHRREITGTTPSPSRKNKP
jgi:predicted nuclease of restriction endonuclease-like (RecB) superfamily